MALCKQCHRSGRHLKWCASWKRKACEGDNHLAGCAHAPKTCGIPSMTLGPCDREWGHDGDMHASAGDGFYARRHDAEHQERQRERKADEHAPRRKRKR